jgi:hypothetical protein
MTLLNSFILSLLLIWITVGAFVFIDSTDGNLVREMTWIGFIMAFPVYIIVSIVCTPIVFLAILLVGSCDLFEKIKKPFFTGKTYYRE